MSAPSSSGPETAAVSLTEGIDIQKVIEEVESHESVGWSASPRLRVLDKIVSYLLTTLFLVSLVFTAVVTSLRYFANVNMSSSLQISSLLLGGLVFLGSAVAFNNGEHRSLRVVVDRFPEKVRTAVDSFTISLVGALSFILTWGSFRWMISEHGTLIGTPIPSWVEALPILLGMVLLDVYTVVLLIDKGAFGSLSGILGLVVMGGVVFLTIMIYPSMKSLGGAFVFYLIVLLVLLFLGTPVGFTFGIASIGLSLSAADPVTIEAITRRATSSATEFVLLAVPFFIFAGVLMERGGSAAKIIGVAKSFIGHFRGGMGQVTVASMFFMSGVTGSEAADTAAVGTFMRRPMREQGWSGGEATGILVASSVMGSSVPPSLGLVILGSAASLSVGALFMAGILPAAVLALVLAVAVYVRARMRKLKGAPKDSWAKRMKSILGSLPALGIPVLLVFGMVFGLGTPTELAAFVALYVLVIEWAFIRKVKWRDIVDVAGKTAEMSGMILFIVAMASTLVYISTLARIPQNLSTAIVAWAGGSTIAFLFITVLALIPIGMLMEGLPALLLFPPVFIPTAMTLGIDPIHYGILMFIAVYIGANLPPLGAGYFFAAGVLKVPLQKGFGPAVGYLGIVVVGLCILILFPAITTIVPQLIGMKTVG